MLLSHPNICYIFQEKVLEFFFFIFNNRVKFSTQKNFCIKTFSENFDCELTATNLSAETKNQTEGIKGKKKGGEGGGNGH